MAKDKSGEGWVRVKVAVTGDFPRRGNNGQSVSADDDDRDGYEYGARDKSILISFERPFATVTHTVP